VVSCRGALGVGDGTIVTVDGASGEVAVGVDPDAVAATRVGEAQRRQPWPASGDRGAPATATR